MASERELLTARIFLRAVLPVMKVLVEDDPATARRFKGLTATVQFLAQDPGGALGAYITFTDGAFGLTQGVADRADLTFAFSSLAKMNAFFAGKPVLPRIRGWRNVSLLIKMFGLLLGMKLLLPTKKPKSPQQALVKVKMTLYMVSTALSQLNKAGDPDMVKWTTKQPERIYQWSCEPGGIACYLRVKAGKTMAGRGYYARRIPFVHTRFNGVEGALPVLSNEVEIVQAVSKGHLTIDGSPEYGGQIGDFMVRIAKLVT